MKRFLSLLVTFASATSALAQAPAPDQPALPRTTNILEAIYLLDLCVRQPQTSLAAEVRLRMDVLA